MLNNLSSVNQRKSHQNDRSSGSVDPNTAASNLSKNANNNEDSGTLKPLSDISQDSQSRSQLQSRIQDDQKKFGAADDSLHFRDTFKQAATNSTSMSVTSKNITTASYLNQNNQFITSQPIPTQKSFSGSDIQANQYEPKTGIEELERRLNELESSASKANVTILQTMFTAAKPEPAETSTKQQSPYKRTTKASPQKSQNNSEISVEKPVSENSNSLSKNNSQQPKSDSDNYYQQSENNESSQRENKKKAKRQEKKRNNNANNDELQPTLEEESHHEGQTSDLNNQNNTQTQEKSEQEVEVTFEVLKQSSSDEANLADQLQASSASFNRSLTRPQDSYSHNNKSLEETEDFKNQPYAASGDLRNQLNSGPTTSPVKNPSTHVTQDDQDDETENYQLSQGSVAEKNCRAQKILNNQEPSQRNFEVEASRESLSRQMGQNKKGTNARKVENNNEDSIQNSTQNSGLEHESEYFQGSNIGTQKPVQNKKKSQKSKKHQKQHTEQEEQEGHEEEEGEAASYSQNSHREHQSQKQQSRGQQQSGVHHSQSINSEKDYREESANAQRQRGNESPLSHENPSLKNSQNIHHHNPFYPTNSGYQGLEKPSSKKHNFNLDISQGQSQNSQSQEASSHSYHPHQVPQKKYENSPVKNTKPYLVNNHNNHPGSQNHDEENSLENNDKEEISQVLSVYSKRENNQTRNELNDSHHQGSDRGGANQSHPNFSQENVNNFKHSFEKIGKQETPTHFEIGKSELSELRLSRMSEEQAASLYEQRKNDIQKSIQKISKNKKKIVQSTPKNQQSHPTSSQPIQMMTREQIPATKKKFNPPPPSETQSDAHSQHKDVTAPARDRAIKKSNPQPRNQLSPKNEQTNPTPTTAATVMTEEKIEKTQPKKKVSELKLKATVHVNPNASANNAHVNANSKQNSHRQQDASKEQVVDKDPIQIARESILQRMENIEKALVKTDGSEERGAPASKKAEQQLRSSAKTNPRDSESNEPRYSSQSRQNLKANNNSYSSKLNTPLVTDPGYEHTTENSNAPTPSKQGGGSSYSQLQRANKLKQSISSEYSQEDERLSRKATDSKIKVETLNLRSTINKRNANGNPSQAAASHRQYSAAVADTTTNNNNRNKIAAAPEKDLPKTKGPQINFSEIPQNSKYNPLSPQKSLDVIQTQEKQILSRENSLSVKRSTGGFQSRLNFSKNGFNQQNNNNKTKNKKNQNQDKNQRAVSASPDYMDNNYSRFYSRETSFEERNRLWVIKKNQKLAENERKQYAEEKSVCTFSPFSGRGSSLTSFDPANFYHKNQEWVEKVKTETLTRGDLEIQKRHNPEPRKPRQKVSPLTAIDAIRSQKLFVTRNLEALKNDIDYKDSSNNKKLKTYLEYDWDDGRLREEIGEIEELYSYVKGLVKKRLDQNTGEPVESVNQDSINAGHPRGRAFSYSYKHKSPNARAASLNNSIDNIRVQTLKKTFNKKEALSSLNSVDRERPHNDKLETSVHSESNLRDLMKNKETKKLTIRDNHYVIIDNNSTNPQVL